MSSPMIQETPNTRNSKIILLSDLLSVPAGRQSLVSFCFQLTLYICFIQWMYSGEIVLSRSHHLFQECCSVSHLYNHFTMGGMEASLIFGKLYRQSSIYKRVYFIITDIVVGVIGRVGLNHQGGGPWQPCQQPSACTAS